MKKEKRFLTTAVLITAMASVIQAQENDTAQKTLQLKEVVISISRSEKNIEDAARSITLISSETIKNSGANSFAELLSQYEGIYITGTGQAPGSLQSIFVRGAASNQTLIMIDGVRITDPSSPSNAADLSEIGLSDIERIEIVRGSHGTGFGSSAIGGSINIITRSKLKDGASAEASFTGGIISKNAPYYNDELFIGYKLKNGLYANAGIFNVNSKDLNSTVDTITNPNTYKHDNLGDDYRKTDITARIGYGSDKINTYVYYKKTYKFTEIDKGAYRDDDNFTLDFNRSLVGYGFLFKPSAKYSFTAYGGVSRMERISVDDSSVINKQGAYNKTYSKDDYTGATSNHEAIATYISEKINCTAGIGISQEEMNTKSYNTYFNTWDSLIPFYATSWSSLDTIKPFTTTFSVFVNTDLSGSLIHKNLSSLFLGLGGRFGNHSIFGNNFTYSINPYYKLNEKSMLYGSWSTGYNAPSLYQLYSPEKYYTSDLKSTNGISLGNKKLKPESSSTFEVGFKQHLSESTFATIAYFETIVKNTIEYVYLWNKNVSIDSLGIGSGDDFRADTYLNIGQQLTHGIEISVRSSVTKKLSIGGNISIASGRYKYSLSGVDTSQTKGNHIQVFSNGQFVIKDIESYGLIRRPVTGNLYADFSPLKNLILGIKVRHAGARLDNQYNFASGPVKVSMYSVKDYTLLDFTIRYSILKELVANVRVENILNEKYQEINGFSTRGRSIFGGIRYSF